MMLRKERCIILYLFQSIDNRIFLNDINNRFDNSIIRSINNNNKRSKRKPCIITGRTEMSLLLLHKHWMFSHKIFNYIENLDFNKHSQETISTLFQHQSIIERTNNVS